MQQQRPYALVIGGTDLNEHALRPELHARMSRAIAVSQAVVAMHPDLAARFTQVSSSFDLLIFQICTLH